MGRVLLEVKRGGVAVGQAATRSSRVIQLGSWQLARSFTERLYQASPPDSFHCRSGGAGACVAEGGGSSWRAGMS